MAVWPLGRVVGVQALRRRSPMANGSPDRPDSRANVSTVHDSAGKPWMARSAGAIAGSATSLLPRNARAWLMPCLCPRVAAGDSAFHGPRGYRPLLRGQGLVIMFG